MFLRKQKGFTLVELLFGIFVGLIILSGMVYFLARTTFYSTMNLRTVRLEYEIQSALDLMTHDIRRAGYWNNASSMVYSGANTNPFMTSGTTNLNLPNSSCILFSYDLNKDGLLPAVGATPDDERFGYRLSSGALQTRPPTDSSFDCSSGSWEDLTDPSILTITNLTFTLTPSVITVTTPPTSEAIVIRYINIVISGSLVSDPSVSTTRSVNIRVRNDEYQP
jgi:prepilin-type N-terminal cleavage/methylation domain-containing protein